MCLAFNWYFLIIISIWNPWHQWHRYVLELRLSRTWLWSVLSSKMWGRVVWLNFACVSEQRSVCILVSCLAYFLPWRWRQYVLLILPDYTASHHEQHYFPSAMMFVYKSTKRMHIREMSEKGGGNRFMAIYLFTQFTNPGSCFYHPRPIWTEFWSICIRSCHQHQPLKIFPNTIVKFSLLNLPTKLNSIRKVIKIRTWE